MLRASDEAALAVFGLDYETEDEGGHTNIIIKNYPLPAGLVPSTTDLLLRVPGGFPDAPPDMFWLAHPVTNHLGQRPPATECVEHHAGRDWVRWSRHITTWRPGTDDMTTYIRFVRHCLDQEAQVVAA